LVIVGVAGVIALAAPRLLAWMTFPWGMDANGDAQISLKEFEQHLASHPVDYHGQDRAGAIPNRPEGYERNFQRVDCDRDGQLSRTEFKRLRKNLFVCTP
jgi:hypothetical protein